MPEGLIKAHQFRLGFRFCRYLHAARDGRITTVKRKTSAAPFLQTIEDDSIGRSVRVILTRRIPSRSRFGKLGLALATAVFRFESQNSGSRFRQSGHSWYCLSVATIITAQDRFPSARDHVSSRAAPWSRHHGWRSSPARYTLFRMNSPRGRQGEAPDWPAGRPPRLSQRDPPRSVRHRAGVAPDHDLNARVKALWSAKPRRAAVSAIVSPFLRRLCAASNFASSASPE